RTRLPKPPPPRRPPPRPPETSVLPAPIVQKSALMKRVALPTKALVLGSLLLVAACSKKAEPAAPPVTKVAVETVEVTTVPTPAEVRLTGTLKGARETDLAANVSGRILETLVERGTRVKKGDIVARVDVRAAALQLAEAKVQVESSRTQEEIDRIECERYEK